MGMRASNIVLSSRKNMKFGIGKQTEEFLPNGNGADGIPVAPYQKNWDVDRSQLASEIGIVGGKPFGEIRMFVFEFVPPIDSTKSGRVEACGSGGKH